MSGLFFERNFVSDAHERVLLKTVVIAVRKIGTIMAAAAFFACNGAAHDKPGEGMQVL